jgi:hypothetical protein
MLYRVTRGESCCVLQINQLEKFISKSLVYALLWSMGGDGKLKVRKELGDFIRSVTTTPLPPGNMALMDFEVCFYFHEEFDSFRC